MTTTSAGWVLFIAALGMMAGLMGVELMNLPELGAVYTTAFIGKSMVHFSTVVAAFIGGKLIPGPSLGDRRDDRKEEPRE